VELCEKQQSRCVPALNSHATFSRAPFIYPFITNGELHSLSFSFLVSVFPSVPSWPYPSPWVDVLRRPNHPIWHRWFLPTLAVSALVKPSRHLLQFCLSVSALVKPLRHLRFRLSFPILALLHLWRDVLTVPLVLPDLGPPAPLVRRSTSP
jgi:hypothetical protein